MNTFLVCLKSFVLIMYGATLVFVPFAFYTRALTWNAPNWLACTVATAVLILVGFICFPKEIFFSTKMEPEVLAKFRRL